MPRSKTRQRLPVLPATPKEDDAIGNAAKARCMATGEDPEDFTAVRVPSSGNRLRSSAELMCQKVPYPSVGIFCRVGIVFKPMIEGLSAGLE